MIPNAISMSLSVEGSHGEALKRTVVKSLVIIFSLLVPAAALYLCCERAAPPLPLHPRFANASVGLCSGSGMRESWRMGSGACALGDGVYGGRFERRFLSLKTNLILVMSMRMKAIYKDAVLKPLAKLDLKEGDVVVINLKKISMRDFHGKVEIEKQIADDIIEMEIWD